MADDKLIFSQDDADRIFTELVDLQVDLDNDPVAFGPKRLNGKVADVRRMLSRCERIYLDVSQRLQTVRRALRVAEAELDISKKYLFANDPETRAGRSVSDREAIAGGKLLTETRAANDLKLTESDLEAVLIVVKAKRGDLKDAEGRLRDQVRLCQEEINLGGHWGSARPHSKIDLNQGRATGADVQALEELLSHVEGEIHLQQLAGDFPADEDAVAGGRDPAPEPAPEPEPEAVFEAVTQKELLQVGLIGSVGPGPESVSEVIPEPVVLDCKKHLENLKSIEQFYGDTETPAEQVSALEPEVAPIPEGALAGTVPAAAVESFLDEPLMPADPPKTRIQKALQEAEDLDMDALLADFENND